MTQETAIEIAISVKENRIKELEEALKAAKYCVDRENINSKYDNTALIINRALRLK